MGTSMNSQNTKKAMRSMLRKIPMIAISRIRNHAVNAFGRTRTYFSDASRPIGISSAVITTMKRLMPSTPTVKRVPSPGIHGRFSTYWKSGLPTWKFQSSQSASPSVATVKM